MRKTMIVLMAILAICFTSCNDSTDIESIGSSTAKESESSVSTPSSSSDTFSSSEKASADNSSSDKTAETFMGFERSYHEIALPVDGETLEYSPAFDVFVDTSGKKLSVTSAHRTGDTITFTTEETEYYFDPLGITIMTSSDELFIGLNGVKQEDGTYNYIIKKYKPSPYNDGQDTTLDQIPRIKKELGSRYDPTKNFYYVRFCNIYDSK